MSTLSVGPSLCLCVCMRTCANVCAHGNQRSTLGACHPLPSHLINLFRVSLSQPGSLRSSWPGSCRKPPVSAGPAPGLWACTATLSLSTWVEHSSSRLSGKPIIAVRAPQGAPLSKHSPQSAGSRSLSLYEVLFLVFLLAWLPQEPLAVAGQKDCIFISGLFPPLIFVIWD